MKPDESRICPEFAFNQFSTEYLLEIFIMFSLSLSLLLSSSQSAFWNLLSWSLSVSVSLLLPICIPEQFL